MTKALIFSFLVTFTFSAHAVDLQNEVTQALEDCFHADLKKSQGSMPNVANHGDINLDTEKQDPSSVRPVIQLSCEGDIAKKFISVATKVLKSTTYPYPGCKDKPDCKSITHQFSIGEPSRPGFAFCITDETRDLAICDFGAVFQMSYR